MLFGDFFVCSSSDCIPQPVSVSNINVAARRFMAGGFLGTWVERSRTRRKLRKKQNRLTRESLHCSRRLRELNPRNPRVLAA